MPTLTMTPAPPATAQYRRLRRRRSFAARLERLHLAPPSETEPFYACRVPVDAADIIAEFRKVYECWGDLLEELLDLLTDDRWEFVDPRNPRTKPPVATAATAQRTPPGAPWISSLTCEDQPNGSVRAVIDGRECVLPGYLGALLQALAEDSGPSRDQCVAFKTLGDLAIRMAKRTGGQPHSAATLNKYAHRLKAYLLDGAGIPRERIQTHPRLGRRLAILRTAVPAATAPLPSSTGSVVGPVTGAVTTEASEPEPDSHA
jgi:hypothetical protein